MKLTIASALFLGSLAAAAPVEIETRGVATQFLWGAGCRKVPYGDIVADFKANSWVRLNCYNWYNGNSDDVWYFSEFGCWISNRSWHPWVNNDKARVMGLPPC